MWQTCSGTGDKLICGQSNICPYPIRTVRQISIRNNKKERQTNDELIDSVNASQEANN